MEKFPPRPDGQAPLLNLPDDATAAGTNTEAAWHPKKTIVSPRLSLHRLDNGLNPVADSIAKQTITAFLPRAILFNSFKVLFHIVERAVKEFRRGLHNAIDGRVAINKNKVRWLFPLAVKLADNIFALSPQRKRTMRVVQGYVVQIFKVRCVNQFPMCGKPKKRIKYCRQHVVGDYPARQHIAVVLPSRSAIFTQPI